MFRWFKWYNFCTKALYIFWFQPAADYEQSKPGVISLNNVEKDRSLARLYRPIHDCNEMLGCSLQLNYFQNSPGVGSGLRYWHNAKLLV